MVVGCLVERDGVLRIAHDVRIGAEAIRHCRESKLAHAQHIAQCLWVVLVAEFE